eukprot:m.1236671 g.1236671  ORF g.1236671 m.1236671 type:complete len:382 (+) comp24667_c1_seq10:767-1912(+)
MMDSDSLDQFAEEVDVMRTLRHRNVVLFLGAGFNEIEVMEEVVRIPYIVVEYMARGSLLTILANSEHELPWELRWRLALDAVNGMIYLHGQTPARIHRDLKSANMLINENWQLKLADFGTASLLSQMGDDNRVRGNSIVSHRTSVSKPRYDVAKRTWFHRGQKKKKTAQTRSENVDDIESIPLIMDDKHSEKPGVWKTMTAAATHESSTDSAHMTNSFAHMTDVVGTLAWMAPEVVRCRRDLMARPAVDVYAFGIVLWELVTRSLPWDDAVRYPDAASIQAAIVGHERPEYDGSDPQGVRMYAMARTCWVDDPRARPSFVTLGDQLREILQDMACDIHAVNRRQETEYDYAGDHAHEGVAGNSGIMTTAFGEPRRNTQTQL